MLPLGMFSMQTEINNTPNSESSSVFVGKSSSKFAIVDIKKGKLSLCSISVFTFAHKARGYRGENLLRWANKTQAETHVPQMSLQHTNESFR